MKEIESESNIGDTIYQLSKIFGDLRAFVLLSELDRLLPFF